VYRMKQRVCEETDTDRSGYVRVAEGHEDLLHRGPFPQEPGEVLPGVVVSPLGGEHPCEERQDKPCDSTRCNSDWPSDNMIYHLRHLTRERFLRPHERRLDVMKA